MYLWWPNKVPQRRTRDSTRSGYQGSLDADLRSDWPWIFSESPDHASNIATHPSNGEIRASNNFAALKLLSGPRDWPAGSEQRNWQGRLAASKGGL